MKVFWGKMLIFQPKRIPEKSVERFVLELDAMQTPEVTFKYVKWYDENSELNKSFSEMNTETIIVFKFSIGE